MATQRPISFGLNRRYGILATILLLLIWIWVAFDRPYRIPTAGWSSSSNSAHSTQSLDAFEIAPVDSEAVRNVCNATRWNHGLVFTCDESVGGIAAVRNSVLNCVRYAIAAGAALVLPTIHMRDPEDEMHIRTGNRSEMGYMFVAEHFVKSLNLSCPGLRTFSSVEQIDDYNGTHKAIPFIPESLVDNIPPTGLPAPENWRASFDVWLGKYSTRTGSEPIIIDLGRSYLQYPIYTDDADFALTFGQILLFPPSIRILATKVIHAISISQSLKLDLNLPIIPDAYFGCHLSTTKDPTEVGPRSNNAPDISAARYESQLQKYMDQVPRTAPQLVYLASGDVVETARFKKDASSLRLSILTKYDLLEDSYEDLVALNGLSWDQQAMVDFLVLEKGSDFAGAAHSGFAWNVALRRHAEGGSRTMDFLDGGKGLSDEFSVIYGKARKVEGFASCMWP